MIITRFAPSPNGPAHVGHLRGLLILKDLVAKRGRLYLRFDDTSNEQYDVSHYRSFLKLCRDYEVPICQVIRASDRLRLYWGAVRRLILRKKAYYCNCPPRELLGKRNDCTCQVRDYKDGPCIRFKSAREPNFVIMRQVNPGDWRPTLSLQSPLDDISLGVNCLYRGKDLEASSARYLEVYCTLSKKKPPVMEYWGRLTFWDSRNNEIFEISKSKGLPPHLSIAQLERNYGRKGIVAFMRDIGKSKNNLKGDLVKLERLSKRYK